jgi:hypothetical protein
MPKEDGTLGAFTPEANGIRKSGDGSGVTCAEPIHKLRVLWKWQRRTSNEESAKIDLVDVILLGVHISKTAQ